MTGCDGILRDELAYNQGVPFAPECIYMALDVPLRPNHCRTQSNNDPWGDGLPRKYRLANFMPLVETACYTLTCYFGKTF